MAVGLSLGRTAPMPTQLSVLESLCVDPLITDRRSRPRRANSQQWVRVPALVAGAIIRVKTERPSSSPTLNLVVLECSHVCGADRTSDREAS